ncbi:BppU family phage baseplate upper protein [Bacillus wiedmannii]|uniref:BppU family phage baseplate upper protein n=1 Tax=Bacillus wiedmannii TaxID=1890302 RepID=UPI002E203EBC|nr:BppU family phage baseplate upper protein [Bacillus wiedmannii]
MRNETIIIDLSSPSLAKTIYSRQNDKNGLKLTVYLREYGKPVDLTGYAVKYEAAGQSSNFVRVDAKVIDATKGIFEYIFSKEAVSTSSLWLAYFAFEKAEERFTTQDLKIVLGSDVKEGSIQIENYIAEFDKLKKQIDALQIAVDKADVVKRSGGTMTGLLTTTDNIRFKASGERSITWRDANDTEYIKLFANNGGNRLGLWSTKNAKSVWEYNGDNDIFNVTANTNLLKKTDGFFDIAQPNGDAIIQAKTATDDILQMVLDKGRGFHTIYAAGSAMNVPTPGVGIRGFANMQGLTYGYIIATDNRNKIWTNFINGAGWQGWVNVNGNDKDVDWTNLTLINGVTNQSGKTSQIKRTGNTVCLNMNVIGVKNNHIIASLPTNFRPIRDLTFSETYVLNNLDTNTGFVTIRADGSVHCEWVAEGTNPLKYWSFTFTYII